MGAAVESAVEGNCWMLDVGCWVLGGFQQSGVSLGVERTVGTQTAENNTVGTQFTANPNVLRHPFQFPFGIQEIATSRTNNHVQASRLQTLCRTLVVPGRRDAGPYYSESEEHP